MKRHAGSICCRAYMPEFTYCGGGAVRGGPKCNAIMAGSPLHEDVAAAYEVASHLCRRAATHPGSGRCAQAQRSGCAESDSPRHFESGNGLSTGRDQGFREHERRHADPARRRQAS
jgi:hypothetical protein